MNPLNEFEMKKRVGYRLFIGQLLFFTNSLITFWHCYYAK